MRYAEDLGFTVSRGDSCTGTGFCRQSMQKKNTQYIHMGKVIQEVMGHADVSTTMNIYAEANPDVTKSVIEKLSKNMDIF